MRHHTVERAYLLLPDAEHARMSCRSSRARARSAALRWSCPSWCGSTQWWRWRLRIDAKDATPTPRFVPVTVEDWCEPEPAQSRLVEAGLPNGVTLRFEYRLDGAGLRELAGAFGVVGGA